MILGNRTLFVLLACVSAVACGCSGSGTPIAPVALPPSTSPTPTPAPTAVRTASPSPSPSPAPSPTPTPSPTATPTPTPVDARPLAKGDTFAYAGTSLETFVYFGSTPNPSATFADALSQTVTDTGVHAFDRAAPYDLVTSEVDLSATERETSTTDAYVATIPIAGAGVGYYTYGFRSIDSGGRHITDTYAAVGDGNGLLDILPETKGAAWSNDGAQTIDESEADGSTSHRVVASDGSYAETDTYPQRSQSSSPPPLIATVAERADGSGTYDTPIFGSGNETLTYSAPAGGTIAVNVRGFTHVVNQWYTLPLYEEHDRDLGMLALPAGCAVPATYGTTANGIEETYTKADAIFGTLESFDQVTYVAGGYPVCTTLSDTTRIFYDYSGQADGPDGLAFSGGTSPLEIETFTATTGLTGTNVSGAARSRGLAVRASFLAAIERHRFARRRRLHA